MNPRTTAVLFVVAALLGAFVWWYEIRGRAEREAAAEAEKQLFPEVEAEEIGWIWLTTTGGEGARLERGERGWRLVEPLAFPADEATADAMASALAQLESETTVEDPQPPEVYGLGEDARVVRFGAGEADHELRIGKETPVGSNSYASTADPARVFAVPTFETRTLERDLLALRDKRPADFDREAVTAIDLRFLGHDVRLVKRDGEWWLREPLEARADEDVVEGLLSELSFLRATGFLDDPPPDAEAGLAPPDFEARLVLGEAGASAGEEAAAEPPEVRIAIGQELAEGVRAVRGAQEALYTIEAARLEDLPLDPVEYRYRTLADYVASDARSFALVFPEEREGATGEVVVHGERGADGWTVEPPMESGKAARLVSELSRLKAADILAESLGGDERAGLGLAPPRATVRVFGARPAEGEPPLLAEVRLGDPNADGVPAGVPDREQVYLLPVGIAEHVPVSLEAFRNRFAAAPEGEEDAAEEDAGREEGAEAAAEPAGPLDAPSPEADAAGEEPAAPPE